MARNSKVTKKKSHDRRPKPGVAGGRPRRGRPKVCIFCAERATWVDYKDVGLLRRFINERGRIKARGATGTCAQHQRDVATAIKTARELALIPYSVRTAGTESRGGRGGDRRGAGSPRPAEGQASEAQASDAESAGDGAPDGDGAADEDEGAAPDEQAEGSIAALT